MEAIITRAGQGERYERENRVVTIRVDLPEVSIHEIEFDNTFEVSPHTHTHTDTLYVIDGEVEILGDQKTTCGAGTLVAAPAGVAHGFRNVGTGLARILVIHAPDNGFATFIRNT